MSGSAQECNFKWHGCRSIAALQVPAKPMPCISWYLPHSLCVGGVSGIASSQGFSHRHHKSPCPTATQQLIGCTLSCWRS